MISAKNLIGMGVYSLEKGFLPERVKDIIYNPDINRVVAFITGEEGADNFFVYPFDIVGAVGKDALIIGFSQHLERKEQLPSGEVMLMNGELNILDKVVLTEHGRECGRVSDLYFNNETGEGEALEIHDHNDLESLLNGRKFLKASVIRKVGRHLVIVSDIQKYENSSVEFANKKIQTVNDYQADVYMDSKPERGE